MNWWKAHHGIATDRKYAVVMRHIAQRAALTLVTDSNALRNVTSNGPVVTGVTRAEIVAVWVWLIDFASQNTPRGSISGAEVDEISVSLDIPDDTVTAILDALRWKGMITGNSLTAFEKRQPLNDKTNAERQKRFRENHRKKTDSNALRNGTNALALAREDEDEDEDEDVLVVLPVNDNYFSPETTEDGRTKQESRVNGKVNGSANGNHVRPSSPSESERTDDMREVLHRYMSMDGTPNQRKAKPPDDRIVLRCLIAIGETPVIDAAVFLRERFVSHEQSPVHANGPKSYAWFVPVLSEHFKGRA